MSEEEWLRANRFTWMKDDQFECYQLLGDLFYGFHHVNTQAVKEHGAGIAYSHYGELSTFDFDHLTRLVMMAHDRSIRASIGPSGPGQIKIILHKRHSRNGRMFERHPTWEEITEKRKAKDGEG